MTSKENGLEQLRQLLGGPTLDDVEKLKKDIRILRHEVRRLSSPSAIVPIVESTIERSVQSNRQKMVSIIRPLIGPIVRKSVADAIKSLVESLDVVLERSLSFNGWRWRLEAKRTGRPLAEVVLKHTLIFRTEYILLIHNRDSTLLSYVSAPNAIYSNKQLFAGLLTAVTSLVQEVFELGADTDRRRSLNSLSLDDLTVWLDSGPTVTIAAVFQGHAPPEYRSMLAELREDVESTFHDELTESHVDGKAFLGADELLSSAMVQTLKPRSKLIHSVAQILVGLLITTALVGIGYAGWRGYTVLKDVKKTTAEMTHVLAEQNANFLADAAMLEAAEREMNSLIPRIEAQNIGLPLANEALIANDLSHLHKQASLLRVPIYVAVKYPNGQEEVAHRIIYRLRSQLENHGVFDYHFLRAQPSRDSNLAFHVKQSDEATHVE